VNSYITGGRRFDLIRWHVNDMTFSVLNKLRARNGCASSQKVTTAWLILAILCRTKCSLVPIQRSHQSNRRRSIPPTKSRHFLCAVHNVPSPTHIPTKTKMRLPHFRQWDFGPSLLLQNLRSRRYSCTARL
jgi:hypothetical protein